MGLDVYLYQFRNVDTDAILKLWAFSEEPWAFEYYNKWSALPQAERGPYPSEADKADSRGRLAAKARALGLPEGIVGDPSFGGVQVCFPSERHPELRVGDWYSLSTTRALMKEFTGRELDYVFPQANGSSRLFRPNWPEARKRLAEMLELLRKLERGQIERFSPSLVNSLDPHLHQIEVMIETVDFVLSSENPNEFLILWSN